MPKLHLGFAALATLIAAPAVAQDTFCGEAGTGGQWIGGAAETSDIATTENFGEQMALVLNGNRYVGLFSISEATEVRIEAAGRGNGDPTLSLLGPDGAEIATDDDSGGNGASRIETTLEPGDYCAVVRSFDDSPMTAFVRVGRTDMEALTTGVDDAPESSPNSTPSPERVQGCADGRDLGVLSSDGLTYQGSAADAGFARFTLDAPTAISVTANNTEADPTLTLIGPDDETLGENDDFDGLNSRIDAATPLAAGTYCIALDAISDRSLPIDVAVSAYDAAAALAVLFSKGEAAPPLDGSVAIVDLGALPNRLRRDEQITGNATWFSLTLDAPGLLLVEAIASGAGGDPWLVMYDDLGREVAQDDDGGDDTNARMVARTVPGTYLIGLKQVGDQTGFVRLLAERFVPAP
ncbi:ABC transporter substrate-binding protein [Loktanella sp. R86503]|uniref:ABC transporter substrate-binding protein n=1 Tax=Loktanella sp. R86503 TaxID=3093847 RepID=UPI0036D8C279